MFMFTEETNTKLGDFEYAIADIEKNIGVENNDQENIEYNQDNEENGSESDNKQYDPSEDLKNIVKQQLANESI